MILDLVRLTQIILSNFFNKILIFSMFLDYFDMFI